MLSFQDHSLFYVGWFFKVKLHQRFLHLYSSLAIFDLLVVDNKIINPDRSSGRGSQLISKDLCEFYRPDPIVNYLAEDKSDFRYTQLANLVSRASRLALSPLEATILQNLRCIMIY